jgi:gas vesicle protein
MKSEKIIAGVAIGAIAALILIPRTRKMLTDALGSITDALKNFSEDAKGMVEKGNTELNVIAEKAKETAGLVKGTRQAWQ